MITHRAFIGMGTNLGDRVANIRQALALLAKFCSVEETSFLYETPPAYVFDQSPFLNGVCRISTTHAPQELLAALEQIMTTMGRVRQQLYGPRVIDLDILFYDDLVYRSNPHEADLTIPHPLIGERDFVLEPLCDVAPDLVHPVSGLPLHQLLEKLGSAPLPKVMPVGDQLWRWGRKSYIMGIVNVTPDSFSGDGIWPAENETVQKAVDQAQFFAATGADCLDIGGHSTRPGHDLVPAEEEMARVLPVIRALSSAVNLPISVDTFRAEVADAALDAGAKIINDVWSMGFDQQIGNLAAQRNVPLILMHNRADVPYRGRLAIPPAGPPFEYDDLLADISNELNDRAKIAMGKGIRRWSLILDPGMGFGKTLEQHLILLDRLNVLRSRGYPLLFGSSRKGFIGKILDDRPPQERLEGTLATNVVAITRGADILRVHDVAAMARAARVTDAIVRHTSSHQ